MLVRVSILHVHQTARQVSGVATQANVDLDASQPARHLTQPFIRVTMPFVSFAELAASNVPFVSCKSSRSRTTTQWQPDMYMHRCVWREVRTCQHSSSPHILQQVLENVTLDEIAFDHLQLALTSDSHAVHAQNHPQGQLLHHHANLRPQQHDQHFDTVSP